MSEQAKEGLVRALLTLAALILILTLAVCGFTYLFTPPLPHPASTGFSDL